MSVEAAELLAHAEVLLEDRQIVEAEVAFYRAEESGADPDRCAGGRWMTAMLRGDFSAAWYESDQIRKRGTPDEHRFWQGEDIVGKRVIVRCLHGFGDAVQFLRYAPRLQAVASSLIVEVNPRMMELARCIYGVNEVITWDDAAPSSPPEWDVQVEVMELPYLFRTKIEQLPLETNYIRIPNAIAKRVTGILGKRKKPRVGMVWSCGEWNLSRSVPFEYLRAILEESGCEFWNLQGGEVRSQAYGALCDAPDICDGDLLCLAGVVSQLDLLITVDTLAPHLAGAMDIPAWVMVQHAADWRWMMSRNDSPWYPSLRLFRQPKQGDWEPVITDVQRALRQWISRQHYGAKAA
ncbi:MAG: ADP-heptose--LPS heptosyltransferase [Acidobacteria bacterium]|nr:ADP-heptose--LPS heptosyltransferase [Acidobacteriota bacterium]